MSALKGFPYTHELLADREEREKHLKIAEEDEEDRSNSNKEACAEEG
jgi:hypothetical protein